MSTEMSFSMDQDTEATDEKKGILPLKKNDLYEVRIHGYSSEGAGVGRIHGQVVFVKGAIDGELVRARILKSGKNLAYAKIEQLLESSSHRTLPQCPVYGKCGGCDLLHMDYEEELRFKQQRVHNALARIGGVEIELDQIGAAGRIGYRNKAIYNVGIQSYGFYRKHSHDVVDASGCLIQNEPSARAMKTVWKWIQDFNISTYDEETHKGCVRRVFCRLAQVTGQLQVTIVTATPALDHKKELIGRLLEACPEIKSISQNINSTSGNTVMSGVYRKLWGKETIDDELCGLQYTLSPESFYQVNHDQAQKLYNRAGEYADLTGQERLLDMYCGTGTITLFMAQKAKTVTGVEIVEAAIEDAKQNALRNGIQNAEFICADAAVMAEKMKKEGVTPDVIVVDPPRKGLDFEVPACLAGMNPDRIVYISCDPETLARDVKLFSELGYKVQKGTIVDMFPGTYHVETVVCLRKMH